MSDRLEFVVENLPDLIVGFPGHRPGGLLLSVGMALVGLGAGFAVSVPLAAALDSRSGWVRSLAGTYLQVLRGVPLILLLLIVHQLLAADRVLGFASTSLTSALITLVLYSSAYQADIIRTGLRSVPAVLVDDSRLLGSSTLRTYRQVRLPYALRVMQPALTGQAITLFKDTSVVVILGVADLTTTARIVLGSDVANAPYWVTTYLTVGVMYLVVALGLSRLASRLEPRLASSDRVVSLAKLG